MPKQEIAEHDILHTAVRIGLLVWLRSMAQAEEDVVSATDNEATVGALSEFSRNTSPLLT